MSGIDLSTASRRNSPPAYAQWWVLTLRTIAPSLRNGEFGLSVIAPIFFTVTVYLPLSGVMKDSIPNVTSYAQFVMPMILLQGAAFSSITAAFRAATDQVEGINRRFAAMPIAAWTPVAARMTANMIRAVITTVAALICGYVIGFRFYLSPVYAIAFFLVALLIGLVLALIADVLGSVTKSPEAVSQAMIVPQMFFGLLSSGIAPDDQFPGWLAPFVRNQPISQLANLLRALSGETPTSGPPTWSQVAPGLLWLALLIGLLAPLAVRMNSRRG
ncbi:ABC transporter permease [Smaragdicoccus niigatensis]|uniref:ABC transporter permease n=1 Tax=Smaragdicoccus niigatensis TaxID=359359 RepID=UPI000376423E|nr:ABC transporter permease [Smaragdicoccus niigatensis]